MHEDPVLRLVFTQPDDALVPTQRPESLASAIENLTGRPTRIYFVNENDMVLQAVASGQADAAFVDTASAWYGWKRFGLDIAAAQLEKDGRPFYEASAWVRTNTSYSSMESLRGARSCHTGLLTSEGTFLPLSWMLENSLVTRVGPDEVSSIEPTFASFFSAVRIPRSESDPYGNYRGALRCLSEGLGDVAFIKDTTPETFCGSEVQGRSSWCLGLSEYKRIQAFGKVPSHPVVVGTLSVHKRNDLVRGLVGLSATNAGRVLMASVLGTSGVIAVNSSIDYLADYSQRLAGVPGLSSAAGMQAFADAEQKEGHEASDTG